MYRVSISRVLSQLVNRPLGQFNGYLVHSVIVVSIFREFADRFIVYNNPFFIFNRIHFRVFNRAEGVCRYGKPRNAKSHQSSDITVQKCHLTLFICVFIVHVMNDIHYINIESAQPVSVNIETSHSVFVVDRPVSDRFHLRADSFPSSFVHASVKSQAKNFCQVVSGTKELHLFPHFYRGNAAGDGIVISIGLPHNIIILILNRIGID